MITEQIWDRILCFYYALFSVEEDEIQDLFIDTEEAYDHGEISRSQFLYLQRGFRALVTRYHQKVGPG